MTKMIGWCGEQERYVQAVDYDDNPLFNADGTPLLDIDERHENRRDIVMENVTAREILQNTPPGYSRKYVWGPLKGTFVQEMTDDDWKQLQASSVGVNFIDVTDDPREERFMRPTEDFFHHVDDD